MRPSVAESRYAWLRLSATLALMTIGAVGMYAMAVALPAIQAEFSVTRSQASLPYTLTMVGFGLGGIFMGRLADRFGAMVPVLAGTTCLGGGFIAASHAPSLLLFSLAHGALIGVGCSATFAPLLADTSHWFVRRRGIAVAIAASGNYLGGALWPTLLEHALDANGWRTTYFWVGVSCLAFMLPLALALARRAPAHASEAHGAPEHVRRPLGLSPASLSALLALAGVACCVAMSMPQVHIVAYCGDLGYGAARGAEMLSLMLGFGIVSRLASGWVCDHIGGLRTLIMGSALQGIALALFLPFDGLVSL